MKWLLAVFGLMVLLLIIFAMLTSGPIDTANQPASLKTAPVLAVTLYCPDCAAAGMQINLWDAPNGRVIARVSHDTPATELGRRTIGGKTFVQVQTNDGQMGWLAASLVRSR